MSFKKMSKIRQFRDVVRDVRWKAQFLRMEDNVPVMDRNAPLPTIRYTGTVKIHGTNGSVIKLAHEFGQLGPGDWLYQSRNRRLTPVSDNNGFAFAMQTALDAGTLEPFFNEVVQSAWGEPEEGFSYGIYGEWCGAGVQKGVGVSGIGRKVFVVFLVARISEILSEDDPDNDAEDGGADRRAAYRTPGVPAHPERFNAAGLYTITQFPTYEVEIDFNDPQEVVERIDQLVDEVETSCPVAEALGSPGTGEGIVFRPSENQPEWQRSDFWFKAKGEKHKATKGPKTGTTIDYEKVASAKAFAEAVCTEVRLQQGWDYLVEMQIELSKKNTGTFIKWVTEDAVTEEGGMLAESGLEPKDVRGAVGECARNWFFQKLDEEI